MLIDSSGEKKINLARNEITFSSERTRRCRGRGKARRINRCRRGRDTIFGVKNWLHRKHSREDPRLNAARLMDRPAVFLRPNFRYRCLAIVKKKGKVEKGTLNRRSWYTYRGAAAGPGGTNNVVKLL